MTARCSGSIHYRFDEVRADLAAVRHLERWSR